MFKFCLLKQVSQQDSTIKIISVGHWYEFKIMNLFIY